MAYHRSVPLYCDMNPQRIRFGSFEFDLNSLELKREGVPVPLDLQSGQVLWMLIRRAGQIVSREELRKAIWDQQETVDFESELNLSVAAIRDTLGDDTIVPRYIRTVQRGYRFICPVESIEAVPEPAAPTAEALPEESKIPGYLLPLAGLAALLVGGMIFFAVHSRRPTENITVAVARFENETGDASLTGFSDGLTDNLVQQLNSIGDGRFSAVGNAAGVHAPRDQRDLAILSSSLHARYVVLGHVQRSGSDTRIMAHLIQMPEQTQIWVVRLDWPFDDPMAIQSNAARQIASEFSTRLTDRDRSR